MGISAASDCDLVIGISMMYGLCVYPASSDSAAPHGAWFRVEGLGLRLEEPEKKRDALTCRVLMAKDHGADQLTITT